MIFALGAQKAGALTVGPNQTVELPYDFSSIPIDPPFLTMAFSVAFDRSGDVLDAGEDVSVRITTTGGDLLRLFVFSDNFSPTGAKTFGAQSRVFVQERTGTVEVTAQSDTSFDLESFTLGFSPQVDLTGESIRSLELLQSSNGSTPTAVPVPSAFASMLGGLLLFGAVRRRT